MWQRLSRIQIIRLIFGGLIILLVAGGLIASRQSQATPSGCQVTSSSANPIQHGAITEFALPHPHSDLMSPAIDQQGNVWFGEMGRNRIGRFDPATRTFTEWTPPRGANGIMGILPASDGSIWYAEESIHVIGHLEPSRCTFTFYDLPDYAGHRAAPNALAFDGKQTLYVTQFGNSTLGALDIHSGKIAQYHIPPSRNQVAPYGLTIAADGHIWFTDLGNGQIGSLDPATGTFTITDLPDTNGLPNVIRMGNDGSLYATVMDNGMVMKIDPATHAMTSYAVPADYGNVAQLYDLYPVGDHTLWLTSSGANALLKLDLSNGNWERFLLPFAGSSPYGLALDASERLWFTEGSDDANRIGYIQLQP